VRLRVGAADARGRHTSTSRTNCAAVRKGRTRNRQRSRAVRWSQIRSVEFVAHDRFRACSGSIRLFDLDNGSLERISEFTRMTPRVGLSELFLVRHVSNPILVSIRLPEPAMRGAHRQRSPRAAPPHTARRSGLPPCRACRPRGTPRWRGRPTAVNGSPSASGPRGPV
jgi:hypothetical protein